VITLPLGKMTAAKEQAVQEVTRYIV